jgi:hypothetical protein
LAYTTAGGVVGAAVTNCLSKNQERRQLRAAVMQQLLRVAAVPTRCATSCRAGRGVRHGIRPGHGRRPPRASAGSAVLADGRDAEHAQREAMADLVVAALSAGTPRRVLDFAGGGEERALQCEVVAVIDGRSGGVLGESLGELMTQCEEYRQATAQHLLRALWHPWRTRSGMRVRRRRLRQDAAALHRGQEAAMSLLAQPQYSDALAGLFGQHQDPPRVNGPGPAA